MNGLSLVGLLLMLGAPFVAYRVADRRYRRIEREALETLRRYAEERGSGDGYR